MNIQGDAKIVLNNTSFVNNGNFNAGTSTVMLTGQDGAHQVIGGNSRTVLSSLVIDRPLQEVQLNGDISVTSVLFMNNGNLELNNHRLDLGTAGSINGESVNARITGANGGVITSTAVLNAPKNANPGNTGVLINSNSNLGTTTITRGHIQQINAEGKKSIQRYYDVQPAFNAGDITMNIHYFEPELAGNRPTELVLWKLNSNRFTLGADSKAALSVYPNPARDRFTVTLYSPKSKEAIINLQDARGIVLERRQVRIAAGLNTLQWDISMYAAGTYYVAVDDSNVKIVKQ